MFLPLFVLSNQINVGEGVLNTFFPQYNWVILLINGDVTHLKRENTVYPTVITETANPILLPVAC